MTTRLFALICASVVFGCASGGEDAPGAGGAGSGGGGGSSGVMVTAGLGGAGTGGGSGDGGSSNGGSAGALQGGSSGAGIAGGGVGNGGTAGAGGATAGTSGTAGGAGSGGAGAGGASGSAGAAGTGGAAGAAGELGGTPTEETLPALPTVRQEHAVAALMGEVYVIGGYTPSATASIQAYDPETMMWRDAPDFPGPLQHANAAVANGKLYVAGFYIGGDMTNASAQVFEYTPGDDDWVERAPLPANTERGTSCVAVLGTSIYLFGGGRDGQTVADASVYDAIGNSWQELPDLPAPREHCVAGAIEGKIYIAAGRRGGIGGFDPTTLEFDPASPGYVEKEPIPTPRGGVAGAVLRDKLFVFGGEGSDDDPNGVFPEIEAYDPVSDSWEPLPPMATPRHGYGAATLGDRIYLPGGATSEGFGAVDDASVFFFE